MQSSYKYTIPNLAVSITPMTTSTSVRRFWLVKSEPGVFSFDDLLAMPRQTTHWDGVRNYQARNSMRDGMKKGDLVFFYHSSADPAEIVGVAEVAREAYPDTTALDPKHAHFDPKSDAAAPTWFMVDIKAVEKRIKTSTPKLELDKRDAGGLLGDASVKNKDKDK